MAAGREPCGQGGRSMKDVIIITGASSGFGALVARALARAVHTVYASMRETAGRNAPQVAEAQKYAAKHNVDLRTIDLDVASEASADAQRGSHGLRTGGSLHSRTVRRALRRQCAQCAAREPRSPAAIAQAGEGLLIWVSSSSSAGGTPPYLAPYFAAKAAMDALAVVYARELSRWGIETSIVVPGAFTKGTNHFAHSGRPADEARLAEYEAGPYRGFSEQVQEAFAAIVPDDADAGGVADLIVNVVDTPFGKRPFRV